MAPYAPLDPPKILSQPRKKVDYFYDVDIGNYAYASGHPMKQHRARLAHSLVMNYDLYTKMSIFRAKPASKEEMTQFHAEDYVDFLAKVTHDNLGSMNKEQMRFNVGDDCPVFDGLFQYCGISAGGSMEGAARLGKGKCDIAVNWAGGLHHAKKSEASGFCYVNDIVLAIIELLRYYNRVLYIDIDVHHGDGVEEAFYTTDRVMTVSFHQYGEFFPGTGELGDIGADKGRNYSINFPLRQGIDDASYKNIFESVMSKVMEHYQPGAVVLQCGGDSLAGDKLGSLNLSMRGHANCVSFMKSFGVPLLILGGGGYTMRNVSRTWAYETGLAVGVDLPEEIPLHEYSEYYAPDYTLDVKASDMPDQNTVEYLEKIKIKIFELLKETTFVPSVQQQDVGDTSLAMDADMEDELDDADEDDNKDVRDTQRRADQRIEVEGELMDSDDEGDPKPISNRDADESKVPSETEDAMEVEETNGNAPEANGSTNGDVEMRDEGEDEHVNGNGNSVDTAEASKSPQAREEQKESE